MKKFITDKETRTKAVSFLNDYLQLSNNIDKKNYLNIDMKTMFIINRALDEQAFKNKNKKLYNQSINLQLDYVKLNNYKQWDYIISFQNYIIKNNAMFILFSLPL